MDREHAKEHSRGGTATGEVASIKRYMVHDGPGIRSVVFLKGCPLRCVWCSSPQTWSETKNLIYRVKKCMRCGSCIAACAEGALTASAEGTVVPDRGKCTRCGACIEACPTTAIAFDSGTMTVDEVLAVLERDRAFYQESGGGITFSGGEPTVQADFLGALLAACRNAGFHTAIETTGCVEWSVLQRLLPSIDLVLYDLKSLEPGRHEELTGRRNETILANLGRIAAAGAPSLEVHIPVIPRLNDGDEYLGQLGAYLGGIGVRAVQFLPFHKLGSHEYDELGQRYPMENAESIPSSRMEAIRERFRSLGFTVGT